MEVRATSKKHFKLKCVCKMCGNKKDIIVLKSAYHGWKYSMLIQDAFPELTPADRELIQSGICGLCFDKLFKEEEDECDATEIDIY